MLARLSFSLLVLVFGLAVVTAGCLSPEDRARLNSIGERLVTIEKEIEGGIKDGTLNVTDAVKLAAEANAMREEIASIRERAGASWIEMVGALLTGIVSAVASRAGLGAILKVRNGVPAPS